MLSLFPVPYPLTKNVNQNSDSCSTNNYKSLKPKLENLSSLPPDSDRTSEVYLHEELQQDMQKFKNEVDTLEEEFLALKKENIQLHKEVGFYLLPLFVFSLLIIWSILIFNLGKAHEKHTVWLSKSGIVCRNR